MPPIGLHFPAVVKVSERAVPEVAPRARTAEVAPLDVENPPPLDPDAVARAYRFHRAKREARKRLHLERRGASMRFWFVFALVLAATALLAARTLGEIERIFGL
jgi:hypothetical protein